MALKTRIRDQQSARATALRKSNAARLSGEYKLQRLRVRGVFVGIGKAIVSVLLFGIVVSLTAYSRTPTVHVATTPDSSVQINEVTRLYPVTMERVVTPHSVEDIASAVRSTPGPVSIGGGRYSMGGQTAVPDGVQIDMRSYHGVISLDTAARVVVVRSGTTWRELQQVIDRAGLSVKVMQTYNTFTVGGALSVNAHGRYVGQGPLIRSVRQITMVLADGSVVTASPSENANLFYGAVGGYGALGVVADVTLDLASNTKVRRDDERMPATSYLAWFRKRVRDDSTVIFHNADIYPPAYDDVHAVSYRTTDAPLTVQERLLPADQNGWNHRLVYSMITGWPKGKWLREHVVDPFIFRGNPVTWRNYEASYDVSELEPTSRVRETYVLQEYFVPVDSVMVFLSRMRHVLQSHNVNAVNVSIRHALPDPGTYLAWAPNESFAFVLYYKQRIDPEARREVARWTREMIDSVVASGGRHYLPYQPVATRAQFAQAYPTSTSLFDLKRRLDPTSKFTNALWDLYQSNADGSAAPVTAARMPASLPAEVRVALDTMRAYAREEGQEFLTHPEWDLVYTSEAYATWLEHGKRPSQFPYIGSLGTFWESYFKTYDAAKTRYDVDFGTHAMLDVIGVSTAIEYGLKGIYEGTIGRVFELNMPNGGTAEDKYAAKVARDYATLIATRGWYEFGFAHALHDLWTTVPMTGPGFLRKWERRFALSAEYSIKAVYATVIGMGTAASYAPDDLTRYVVAAGWNDSLGVASDSAAHVFKSVASLDRGYALLSAGRYDPFRDGLLALSDHADQVRLAELSGNEVVTVSGTAPIAWRTPPRSAVVVAYPMPDDHSRTRMLLRVNARDLLDVLHGMRTGQQFKVEHIYDY
ncbi:MAG TPA: FAD-binding oxidoreductase [Gemmatimonadaceae bacterium]|jgi:FAD/FMN-containing dehydrogenase